MKVAFDKIQTINSSQSDRSMANNNLKNKNEDEGDWFLGRHHVLFNKHLFDGQEGATTDTTRLEYSGMAFLV